MYRNKVQKVRKLLQSKGLTGVLVIAQVNVAWLTGGRYHINIASENSAAWVWINADEVVCVVNNIEAERLRSEEGLDCDRMVVYPWYNEEQRDAVVSNWLMQVGATRDTDLSEEFMGLRLQLDSTDIRHFRELGQLTARAIENVCWQCLPDQRETEVAGMLAEACLSNGLDVMVNLVTGARRAQLYRHFLPTKELIGEYCILSVSARRWGLVASATRMVSFGDVSPQLQKKYHDVLQVEAALLTASQPGRLLSEALRSGVEEYRLLGYEEEWTFHHQGGMAGYQSRELRATPNSL